MKESFQNTEHTYSYYDRLQRHDIYEFSKETAIFAEQEGVKNIIFLDTSARLAWIGVNEYWNTNFDDKPKPGMYFVNPTAFDPENEMYEDVEAPDDGSLLVVKDGKIKSVNQNAAIENLIKERFNELFINLNDQKDEPILIFDTCSHSGETIRHVKNILTKLGFKHIKILTANLPDHVSNIEVDRDISENALMSTCYPFGTDDSVIKGDDLVSELNPDSDPFENFEKRTEIKQIIADKGQ